MNAYQPPMVVAALGEIFMFNLFSISTALVLALLFGLLDFLIQTA